MRDGSMLLCAFTDRLPPVRHFSFSSAVRPVISACAGFRAIASTASPVTPEAEADRAAQVWEEATAEVERRNRRVLRRQHLLSSRPLVPTSSLAEITWCALRVVAREAFPTLRELLRLRAVRPSYNRALQAAIFALKDQIHQLERLKEHRDQLLAQYLGALGQVRALEASLEAYGVLIRRRI